MEPATKNDVEFWGLMIASVVCLSDDSDVGAVVGVAFFLLGLIALWKGRKEIKKDAS